VPASSQRSLISSPWSQQNQGAIAHIDLDFYQNGVIAYGKRLNLPARENVVYSIS
jgi:hypothetical protein